MNEGPVVYTRVRSARLRVAEAQGGDGDVELVGYAVRWHERATLFGQTESFARGAFSGKLEDPDIRFLSDHGGLPMAAVPDTLELAEDDTGLRFRVSLSPDNPRAKEVIVEARRGTLRNVSVGFTMGDDAESKLTYDADGDTYHEEIVRVGRLREVSAVAFPAYDGATLEPVTRREQRMEGVPVEEKQEMDPPGGGAQAQDAYDPKNPRFQEALDRMGADELERMGFQRMGDEDREGNDLYEEPPSRMDAEPEEKAEDYEEPPSRMDAEPEPRADVPQPEPAVGGPSDPERMGEVEDVGNRALLDAISSPHTDARTREVLKRAHENTRAGFSVVGH